MSRRSGRSQRWASRRTTARFAFRETARTRATAAPMTAAGRPWWPCCARMWRSSTRFRRTVGSRLKRSDPEHSAVAACCLWNRSMNSTHPHGRQRGWDGAAGSRVVEDPDLERLCNFDNQFDDALRRAEHAAIPALAEREFAKNLFVHLAKGMAGQLDRRQRAQDKALPIMPRANPAGPNESGPRLARVAGSGSLCRKASLSASPRPCGRGGSAT